MEVKNDEKDETAPAQKEESSEQLLRQAQQKQLAYITELVVATPGRNWKGIVAALIVILIVCGLIVMAIILITPGAEVLDTGSPVSFEDIFSSEFIARRFWAKWIGGCNCYMYRNSEGHLLMYDVDNNVTQLLLDNITLLQKNVDTYFLSHDGRHLLLACDVNMVYRYTFTAEYLTYDKKEKEFTSVPYESDHQWKNVRLQHGSWSPKGNSLIFVYKNNIYYQTSPSSSPIQITNSGSDVISNGLPDWLYEEEILSSSHAIWWSTDGQYAAFLQFNDTMVPKYRYTVYGDRSNIYSDTREIHYPKAGYTDRNINPSVKLYVIDLSTYLFKLIEPPSSLTKSDHYITMVKWLNSDHLTVAWSNRAQNKTVITLCRNEKSSPRCVENYVQEQIDGRGWIFLNSVLPVQSGRQYAILLPKFEGTTGYWIHIALITADMDKRNRKTFVTSGSYDVIEILSYEDDTRCLYYTSTMGDPRQKFILRTNISDDDSGTYNTECLSCSRCQCATASFSHSGKYYIEKCLGPDIPTATLRNSFNNTYGVVLESNKDIQERLKTKALPRKEYFRVPTDDGEELWGYMLLPPSLNPKHVTLYPMLMYTYSGPGTHVVTDEFKFSWGTYLSSSQNVIYAMIDGRGSAGRGQRFLHAVYKRLGTVEVQDQIQSAKYLTSQHSYIDKERIAICGWSYGGFVVGHVLGDEKQKVITCGISVAPVTDWRYYDTVYTERYMGFPTSNDNYRGYDEANVADKAAFFNGKKFLLIHGTADDNVHFQHSAQLMKALTDAGVPFASQLYPDRKHELSGGGTSYHMFQSMLQFLNDDCWDGGKPRQSPPPVDETPSKQKG